MQSSHNPSFTRTTEPYSILLGGIGGVVLVSFLFSCSSIPFTQRGTPLGAESALPLSYSMVFIIHGDSDYLYHDPQGNAHRADQEAYLEATRIAERNPQAEVFIFHEIRRKHALLIFPRRDGKFYYYRHGQLLAQESYWRDQGPSRFDPEVTLYNRFLTGEQPQAARLFFYFGHEIPEFGGAGYDASYSQRTFTVPDLADGLKRIAPDDSSKFDLLVLSTCFNGTPYTITALAPYARTIVASPDNLHLSYFDLQPFEQLDAGLREGDVAGFAKNFAQQAFDRLTEDIQTAVTVAVYNVDSVQGYLHSVDSVYDRALTTVKGQTPGSIKHCDCAEDSAYVLPGMSEGVEVFYRPSHFGRLKQKLIHSGWECWMILD
jgi:Clostripain family